MLLIPYQLVYLVFSGESFNQVILVLPYAFGKAARYADVKRTIWSAGENVGTWLLHKVLSYYDLLRHSLVQVRNERASSAIRHREAEGRGGPFLWWIMTESVWIAASLRSLQ